VREFEGDGSAATYGKAEHKSEGHARNNPICRMRLVVQMDGMNCPAIGN
jgi:hypothetical protein